MIESIMAVSGSSRRATGIENARTPDVSRGRTIPGMRASLLEGGV